MKLMFLQRMRKIKDKSYLTVHFKFLSCSSMGREDRGRSPPAPASGLH